MAGCNNNSVEEELFSTPQNTNTQTSSSTSAQEEEIISKDQQTTDELDVSENSTYQNQELGFSFLYSGKYKFQESDEGITIWTKQDYEQIETFVEATPLTLSYAENPINLSLTEWVKESGFLLETEITEQTVSGLDTVRFQWSGMWSYTSVVISVPDSNQVIIITLDNDMTEYQPIFEEIVNSLKVF
ncbi:hypothetical protein Lepto7376_1396 [[Leptolyngbya] sp. PCC 7376]|nr:hypothetical protein Lepto7376_1396 [[Leptolyngbya] sp. PCC 7376]